MASNTPEPSDADLLTDEQLAAMGARAQRFLSHGGNQLASDVLALLDHATNLDRALAAWKARALSAQNTLAAALRAASQQSARAHQAWAGQAPPAPTPRPSTEQPEGVQHADQ